MDIHKAGGGIMFTVEHTRNASEDRLYELFKDRMQKLLQAGMVIVSYVLDQWCNGTNRFSQSEVPTPVSLTSVNPPFPELSVTGLTHPTTKDSVYTPIFRPICLCLAMVRVVLDSKIKSQSLAQPHEFFLRGVLLTL